MPKNVKKKSQILTWIIPQPEDAVLHTLLSWLKEEALFGHHHSVPCILNRVEIGKFWHYGLKCGRGGWHRPSESQIGLNSFLPPTWWFCPTPLWIWWWADVPNWALVKLTLSWQSNIGGHFRHGQDWLLWSQILNNPTNFWKGVQSPGSPTWQDTVLESSGFVNSDGNRCRQRTCSDPHFKTPFTPLFPLAHWIV